MLSKNQELIHKIERAFKSAEHPKTKLGDMEEVGQLRDVRWQEATISDLKDTNSLIFFSREGFYYFLPAYLIIFLRDPKQFGGYRTVALFRALHNCSPPTMTRKQRRELFSKQKTAVIIEFLQWIQTIAFTDEPFHYQKSDQLEIKEHIEYTLQDWLEYAKKRS